MSELLNLAANVGFPLCSYLSLIRIENQLKELTGAIHQLRRQYSPVFVFPFA